LSVSLAQASALLHMAKRSAPDRRRFRRLELGVHGKMLSARGAELDCRTLDVSPGDARIACPAAPDQGDALVLYLHRLGRVEARVVRRLSEGVFAVTFSATAHKREKLVESLTVLLNPSCPVDEERRQPRSAGGGASIAELEDGSKLHCEIVDFSLTGLALKTTHARPLLGEWVRVGGQYGRVSRYFDSGFAIDFEVKRRRPA
jgi:hypothetical protein